jgi:uncharacterized protein YecT (DUF1311 family)
MLILGVVAALLMSAAPAVAASFNCAAATTPRERLICNTPSLSADDDKMAQIYTAALSAVSEKRRDALRAGQRSWLRFLAAICPIVNFTDEAVKETVECIGNNYSSRSGELESAVQRKGPFLFVRIDHYAAFPINPESAEGKEQENFGWGKEMGKLHCSYPQIDQPITPTTTRWNELNVRSGSQRPCKPFNDDTDLDYLITLATSRLISVAWDDSEYGHGAAHPNSVTKVETLMLSPVPHPMQPSDLFRKDVDWAGRLKAEVSKGVTQYFKDGGYSEAAIVGLDRSHIDSVATDPRRWRPTPDGLVVFFQQYELDGYAFVPEITVRWTDIQDLLQPDLHLPPKGAGN